MVAVADGFPSSALLVPRRWRRLRVPLTLTAPSPEMLGLPFRHEGVHLVLRRFNASRARPGRRRRCYASPQTPVADERLLPQPEAVTPPRERSLFVKGVVDLVGVWREQRSAGHRNEGGARPQRRPRRHGAPSAAATVTRRRRRQWRRPPAATTISRAGNDPVGHRRVSRATDAPCGPPTGANPGATRRSVLPAPSVRHRAAAAPSACRRPRSPRRRPGRRRYAAAAATGGLVWRTAPQDLRPSLRSRWEIVDVRDSAAPAASGATPDGPVAVRFAATVGGG